MIHRLDKPDTAHLKQIIQIFSSVGKTLNDTEYQPQIAVDQFFSGSRTALFYLQQQRFFLL